MALVTNCGFSLLFVSHGVSDGHAPGACPSMNRKSVKLFEGTAMQGIRGERVMEN